MAQLEEIALNVPVEDEGRRGFPESGVVTPLTESKSSVGLVADEHQRSRRWSRYYDACIDCGETNRKHISWGLCSRCYKRRLREGTRPKGVDRPWSSIAASCVVCGRTEREHRGHGLCRTCYGRKYMKTEKGQQSAKVYQRRYAQTERGRIARWEGNRRWRAIPANKEKERQCARRSREAYYGIEMTVPLGYEALVFEVFGKRCAACGSEGRLALDHHRPLRDGNQLLHNAVPLCASCNAKKRVKQPECFYDDRRFAEIAELLLEVRQRFEARYSLSAKLDNAAANGGTRAALALG